MFYEPFCTLERISLVYTCSSLQSRFWWFCPPWWGLRNGQKIVLSKRAEWDSLSWLLAYVNRWLLKRLRCWHWHSVEWHTLADSSIPDSWLFALTIWERKVETRSPLLEERKEGEEVRRSRRYYWQPPCSEYRYEKMSSSSMIPYSCL